LERKGWLGSLAGRRRALDRLLPTLRAASDPVTRDLYIARVAEALGVSKSSVEREMASSHSGPSQPIQRPAAGDQPSSRAWEDSPPSDRIQSTTARPGPGGRRPERDLLRIMIHAPEWRSRIGEQVRERKELVEPEAALLAQLADAPATTPPGE